MLNFGTFWNISKKRGVLWRPSWIFSKCSTDSFRPPADSKSAEKIPLESTNDAVCTQNMVSHLASQTKSLTWDFNILPFFLICQKISFSGKPLLWAFENRYSAENLTQQFDTIRLYCAKFSSEYLYFPLRNSSFLGFYFFGDTRYYVYFYIQSFSLTECTGCPKKIRIQENCYFSMEN